MRMLWRRSRCAKKERWCYVGRAGIKGFDPEWWVYLHPTKDEWWFLDRKDGQASRMGRYSNWSRKFDFEPLVRTD